MIDYERLANRVNVGRLVILKRRLGDATARQLAAQAGSPEHAAATRDIDELTARIWSLEDVPPEPEYDVSATLAQLRATHRALAEQRELSRAYLSEAYGAISASWRLLVEIREEPIAEPEAPAESDD